MLKNKLKQTLKRVLTYVPIVAIVGFLIFIPIFAESKTSNSVPTTPSLNAPLDNAYVGATNIVNLNWTNSTDANGDAITYVLKVGNFTDFRNWDFVNYTIKEGINPTNKQVTLTQGEDYYWSVWATDNPLYKAEDSTCRAGFRFNNDTTEHCKGLAITRTGNPLCNTTINDKFFGSCFMNTTAYVTIPNVDTTGWGSISIEFWLWRPGIAGKSLESGNILIHNWNTGAFTFDYDNLYYSGTNYNRLTWHTNTDAGDQYIQSYSYPFNTWIHIATVYDTHTMTLYVNGAVNGTNTDAEGNIKASNQNLIVGLGNFYIDELRVYSKALSLAEIQNSYYSGVSGSPTARNFTLNSGVAPPSDTCTYGGTGNWDMVWDDNCTITSPTKGDGSDFTIAGCGNFVVTSTLSGFKNYNFIPNRLGYQCHTYIIGGRIGE